MTAYAEFPRLLYRPGVANEGPGVENQQLIAGVTYDLLVVDHDDDLEAAKADGWAKSPVAPGKADPSLLDEKADAIIEMIPALTVSALEDLLAAEKAGKTRKGVLAALEAALIKE